jgi:hypothetical protein
MSAFSFATAAPAKPRSCIVSARAKRISRPSCARSISASIPRLTGAAGYSVLAHLEDLVARGLVLTDGDPVIGGSYRMAA